MSITFTVMGCGNSSGVPSVGNHWGACDPHEPKNRRTRCAALVKSATTTLVIDTGPDFREHSIRHEIRAVDAVLYTHQHSDHTHGIDDLRPLFFRNGRNPLDVYAGKDALDELSMRFHYMFGGGVDMEYYPKILNAHTFAPEDYGQTKRIGDIDFIPFEMDHGTCVSVGYRFGNLAYCTDMKSLDKTALNILKGVKIWIVDGAGYDNPRNAVHANLEDIYRYNDVIGAKEVYITSLSTQMDYQNLLDEMPQGFFPAYDGLGFEIG